MERKRWPICKQKFILFCYAITVPDKIGRGHVTTGPQRRRKEQRNRFATYGRISALSLQCVFELRSHYRMLCNLGLWPKSSGLNMASLFTQMLQSTEEMGLVLETILQTSERQLDVVNTSYLLLRAYFLLYHDIAAKIRQSQSWS